MQVRQYLIYLLCLKNRNIFLNKIINLFEEDISKKISFNFINRLSEELFIIEIIYSNNNYLTTVDIVFNLDANLIIVAYEEDTRINRIIYKCLQRNIYTILHDLERNFKINVLLGN